MNLLDLLLENIWGILVVILGSGIIGAGVWNRIKKFIKKGAVVFTELSEAFGTGADFLNKLNKNIENDGKLDATEIRDLINDGKTVIKEFKDVVIEIKPKSQV